MSWLPVPLVKQVTGPEATTVNATSIIPFYFLTLEDLLKPILSILLPVCFNAGNQTPRFESPVLKFSENIQKEKYDRSRLKTFFL